jgi:phosphinothricin acetyltransferase
MPPSPLPLFIRLAKKEDCEAIDAIYNYYVKHSTCTYQLEVESLAERLEWFERHGSRHPIFVCEKDTVIVGWGSLSPFSPRAAWNYTVESSVYVKQDSHRCGIGAALMTKLIASARERGHHTILASIDGEQQASIELHRKFGFKTVAKIPEVGHKFDRWLDVVYMQLMLEN